MLAGMNQLSTVVPTETLTLCGREDKSLLTTFPVGRVWHREPFMSREVTSQRAVRIEPSATVSVFSIHCSARLHVGGFVMPLPWRASRCGTPVGDPGGLWLHGHQGLALFRNALQAEP